jgi:hypothetical protein
MSGFSQKQLESLNQAWVNNEQRKLEAEREIPLAEAQGDSYRLAELYQQYADADQAQHNLHGAYQRAEAAVLQNQNAPQPQNDGLELQKAVWEQIKTGNPQWIVTW